MGTSTDIIMVEKWGDVATSPEEGTTSMEVLPATRAAGEPPRPRRILMTRLDVTGALAARVGRRHGKVCGGRHRLVILWKSVSDYLSEIFWYPPAYYVIGID